MAPSMSFPRSYAPDGIYFRQLAVSPDYSNQHGGAMLATWSASSVPVLKLQSTSADSFLPCVDFDRSVPWVKLPYPAIDIAWCPFKEGDGYASFLTACNSCPLQLWDVEDASLRASYCCRNDAGVPAHPHSILWSGRRSLVAAGYGGIEDKTHVRFFDILQEGTTVQSSYASPCSKGFVSALADGPTPYQENLILAGFIRSGNVDIVDTRHCGAAAVLRGLKSGVSQIMVHPISEYLVYAAGRVGDKRIVCWDIRKSTQLLTTFDRELRTQQPAMFGFIQRKGEGTQSVDLVTATHDGGVLVYEGNTTTTTTTNNNNNNNNYTASSSSLSHTNEPRRIQAALGPTSGLTVLDSNGTIAVTVGERQFDVKDQYESNAGSPQMTERRGKRSRTPLEDHDLSSDNECEEKEKNAGSIVVFRE
ncbi:transducin family protein / WD-40 repeat family protein [Trypanosoma theileri]|uniref:Transducin family protein / WD-40 repeat family protein n=1 Tax=Trypanosoma theileri TaxID=67003 RepID=A0A1X0NRZ3_9TRYP|nr:transducin family protein / WD-40 repeat family protein [Trypanosoma theileri]ORC87457.1 transducin family protein / WD-40 repeat family protein [Trypanosoma theileri]